MFSTQFTMGLPPWPRNHSAARAPGEPPRVGLPSADPSDTHTGVRPMRIAQHADRTGWRPMIVRRAVRISRRRARRRDQRCQRPSRPARCAGKPAAGLGEISAAPRRYSRPARPRPSYSPSSGRSSYRQADGLRAGGSDSRHVAPRGSVRQAASRVFWRGVPVAGSVPWRAASRHRRGCRSRRAGFTSCLFPNICDAAADHEAATEPRSLPPPGRAAARRPDAILLSSLAPSAPRPAWPWQRAPHPDVAHTSLQRG
jgi:hypothetical protein